MERKRRNSGKNTKRTPKVKKKKRTHSDSDTVIRNSVQKTGWFILTQSISAQLLTSEGIISSDDGNVLIDTKSTSVSHVIECVNRHHISAPKKQIKNMTPKQRKVYNSASVKRHRQTKKEMEEKASDCKEKCVKNLSRRFKELSTTEKTEYKTEKQRQRRKAQKAVGNQTDNETHINQDQYKHHCKIRVGLIDLFDVETEAIVIPFYDSSLSDTKSLHQQMRREFSVLAPDLVKKFDTECSKSAWKSSICNYNCEKFFWHKPHEKLSTMSQSSGVSPIFSSKPDLINTYTIHVKVPEVSEKCGLSCVSEAELRSAYLSSLICCDKSQHQSIAFPILGKGVHRNEAVLIALQTIYAYFRTVQHTNIELVYIVTDNSQHYDQIANFLFYVREIDLNKFEFLFDDIQCKEREQLFQKFKFLHIYVANKWKMVMQKAPQKCGCKKVNGTHENLSVFLTKMSHDEIMDKWTLNQRSILLNMKQEDVIESIKIIPGIRKVIMAESEPISHDIALQSVRIWLTRKQILFKEQSAQLDKLIAEVSGYDSTGNESDPNQYNAQLFDEELMSEKYVEEFEDSCGSQNLQASVCMKHFYLHLQNDCAMEQTLRNRQFRMLSISLAAENVEDWEDKVNNRTLTVDEWINEVLKTNQLETLTNFAEDFESDKCFFDTPQSLDKHAFPEYPDCIYLGKRNIECCYCKALSFEKERVKKCCMHGAVSIPPMKKTPPVIERAFSPSLRKYLLTTNTAFSMASISYQREIQAKGGIQSMKVKGMMSFHPSALHPRNESNPRFANFIVLDRSNEEIANLRFNSIFKDKQHRALKPIFEDLQHFFDANNKCYHLYKNMIELERNYIAENGIDKVDNSNLTFRIIPAHDLNKIDLAYHKGVYADPKRMSSDCVTVAFNSNEIDSTIIPRGLNIYPYNPECGNQLPISVFDDNCDKLSYPLLYPEGEGGWALHKFERDTKKGPKPLYETRKQNHIEHLLREGKDPNDYYFSYNAEMVDIEDSKQVEKEECIVDVIHESISGREHELEGKGYEEDKECDSEDEFDIDKIIMNGRLEDEQEFGTICQKPNIRMEQRNGEMVPVIDKNQKTVDIGPFGDPFEIDEENDSPFRFVTEIADDKAHVEDAIDNEIQENVIEEDVIEDGDVEVCLGDEHDVESTALAQKNDGVRVKNVGKRKHVSIAEFATYIFQDRKDTNSFLHGRALTLGQLYRIDLALRMKEQRAMAVIQHRAEYHRSVNRSKVFNFIQGMVNKKMGNQKKALGMLVTLPSTVPGSPKYQRELVMGAITLANTLGRPNIFLTLTGNPKWKEIKEETERLHCEWADVPELVCAVFKTKFELMNEAVLGKKVRSKETKRIVREPGIYGAVKWFSYSVEFQQRGMPHVHMVLALEHPWTTIAEIDRHICAEVPILPNPNDLDNAQKKRHYDLVKEYMVHSPCSDDMSTYCNAARKPSHKTCGKGFPEELCEETTLRPNDYPKYQRTKDRFFEFSRNGVKQLVGSEWVVPHSPFLLMLLETHINVHSIDSITLFKYIFKYIYKGPDRILLEFMESLKRGNAAPDAMTLHGNVFAPANMNAGKIRERKNQANRMMNAAGVALSENNRLVINDCHYMMDLSAMTSCEAAWRLQGYPMHGTSHSVHRLYVHEENNDSFIVNRGVSKEIAEKMLKEKSKGVLEAWFEQNRNPVLLPNGKTTRDLTLPEMPLYYKFDVSKQVFVFRKYDKSDRSFGRIQAPPPYLLELVATRLLSMNVKGPRSWEELRHYNGVTYDTCLQAARARRLMNGEQEWDDLLKEIDSFAKPYEIRRFFVSILVHCAPVNPSELLENNLSMMLENKKSWSLEKKTAHCLRHIQLLLKSHKLSLENFELLDFYKESDLPMITPDVEYDNPEIDILTADEHKLKADDNFKKLNIKQKLFVDSVLKEFGSPGEKSNIFFLEGPGGTGKTFCYQTIYHHLRFKGVVTSCVAHTGIAACLLPFGCTAHRAFSIPLEVSSEMVCRIVIGTTEADVLKRIGAIIWDEACMTDRRVYDAVNILFQELHDNSLPFGGVLVILGGDWRQILPIVEHVRGEGVINFILKRSDLWSQVKKFSLTENQRALSDPDYANLILQIGDGSNYVNEKRNVVAIPEKFVQRGEEADLINWVFPNVNDVESTKNRAILTVDNKSALRINNIIVEKLETEERIFLSEDVACKENGLSVDPEVFATQTPQGLPPHRLRLRIGAQVVLLRNLLVQHGLCNGSRLTVKSFENDIIKCTLNNPLPTSQPIVFLHRIRMSPSGGGTGLSQFTRLQYPIRLSYANTINKSQGQTLERCGLMLHTPVFTHGQLYVAMSRVKKGDSFKLWHYDRRNSDDQYRFGGILVRNIVFKDVLRESTVEDILERKRYEEIKKSEVVSTANTLAPASNSDQDQKGEPEVICDMDSCYEYNFDQKGLNDSLNSFVEDFDLKMATCSKSQYSLGNDSASSPLKRKQSKGVVDIGTKKRKYTRKEIVVEPYLSLENNSHTECFMNTIANIIYTCKGLFEHIVNPTSYPHNSQLKDLLIDIFTKNTNSTRKWRESLADNDYHTGQQDIGEIFHFLIQDLSNEIHSLPIEFEVVKSRECNSCQDIQYFPVVTRNFSYLTISRNDTFETLFENAYSPKVCSNCEKCGGERLEKKTITCHGYYHMMVLNHVQKKFKKLNTNHIFNMFGSNWRIKSFAQYEPHNADGTSGHYMAWIDGGEQWLCINDSFIKCRRKTVDLSQMFIKLIAFEKC